MHNTNKTITTHDIWAWFSTGLIHSLPWSHIFIIFIQWMMKNVNKSPVCFAPLLTCWDSAASPLLVLVSAADAPASLWQEWPTDSPSLLHLSSFHVFLPFLTRIEFMRVYLAMLAPSLVRFGVSAVPLGFITGLKFSFHLQGLKQPHKQHPSKCAAQTRTDKETDENKICV